MNEAPFSKQIRKLVLVGLLVPCLLISVPAIVAYRGESLLDDSLRWVSHTAAVQQQLQQLQLLLLDAETGQRGFLLTSRETFLDPYRRALEKVPQEKAALRSLTADNPVQQEHLRHLDALVAAEMDYLARTISLQQQGRRDTLQTLTAMDQGKEIMDAIRARIARMGLEESRLLVSRQSLLASRTRLNTAFLFALVALNVLFAAVMVVMCRRLLTLRDRVTICAWSRTIEYQGQWISFEEYLQRRFNLDSSHGISPAEAERCFGRDSIENK